MVPKSVTENVTRTVMRYVTENVTVTSRFAGWFTRPSRTSAAAATPCASA